MEDQIESNFQQYKLPETSNKAKLNEVYDEIHQNIEDVNKSLITLFDKKEKQLEKLYSDEMQKAQEKLNELKKLTQEDQLQKKMQEKKENLQKEKKKFIETSMYFSDKCKEFKKILDKVILNTKELESEIQFLNEQIVYADKHNAKLKQELDQLQGEIKETHPDLDLETIDKFQIDQLEKDSKIKRDLSQIKKMRQSQSVLKSQSQSRLFKSIMSDNKQYISPYSKNIVMTNKKEYTQRDIEQANIELEKQKELNKKLNSLLNDPCFQESEFERIFVSCINKVRKDKQEKMKITKFPKLTQNSIINNTMDNTMYTKDNQSEQLDFTTLSYQDFNDFDKRAILDNFLQREEIKRYLYCLIFNPKEEQL